VKVLALASLTLFGTAPFTCEAVTDVWGLGAIRHLKTPPDPAPTCGVVLPADPGASERAACAYGQGARTGTTLGLDPATRGQLPIHHVVVLMKENRSFDHLFGRIVDAGQPEAEGLPPGYQNPDLIGAPVFPFHLSTTCVANDPDHQSAAVVESIASGAMDGFVQSAATSTYTARRNTGTREKIMQNAPAGLDQQLW